LSSETKASTINGIRAKPFTRLSKDFRALLTRAKAEGNRRSHYEAFDDKEQLSFLAAIGVTGVPEATGATIVIAYVKGIAAAIAIILFTGFAGIAVPFVVVVVIFWRYLGIDWRKPRESEPLLRTCMPLYLSSMACVDNP
jgi:hypothetical protein